MKLSGFRLVGSGFSRLPAACSIGGGEPSVEDVERESENVRAQAEGLPDARTDFGLPTEAPQRVRGEHVRLPRTGVRARGSIGGGEPFFERFGGKI